MAIPQTIDLTNTTPAAPTGRQNVQWQGDAGTPRNVSANIPLPLYTITWGIAIGTPATTGTDVTPHYLVPFSGKPLAVTICGKLAPVGADLIVDLLQNGTSILAAPLHLVAGATTGSSTSFASGTLTAGALMTLNCTQIGTTVPGQDVTIQLTVQSS